jgi:hypothetical protein
MIQNTKCCRLFHELLKYRLYGVGRVKVLAAVSESFSRKYTKLYSGNRNAQGWKLAHLDVI